jgi:hypothetical protein
VGAHAKLGVLWKGQSGAALRLEETGGNSNVLFEVGSVKLSIVLCLYSLFRRFIPQNLNQYISGHPAKQNDAQAP